MKKTLLLSLLALTGIAKAQWSLTGNAGITPGANFIGTTDSKDLVFKTNNTEWIRLTTKGRLIFQNIDNGFGWNNNLFIAGGNDFATGLGNTAVGLGSLVFVTTGGGNTSFGANALMENTTGNNNTAIGINSMTNNVGGSDNTSVGLNSLNGGGTLAENTAIGFASMARYNATSSDAVAYNTALGVKTLINIKNGNYNTALGRNALRDLVVGNNNISIGANSASNLSSGSNNILIGYETTVNTGSISNQLNIGNWIKGNNGTIGIGTSNLPADGIATDGNKYKLYVKDGIKTEKVKVDIAADNGWADYVFAKDYKLMPLKEVENYININGHLPEVPSTEEAIQNGIELKEMNILLLKKVEELTLHLIEQDKRIGELEANNKK
ncbi:hypothetical protein [Epilithonimonas arachidiradicis]|uniref:Peptidase S74 domain-containing protein n=1 Tax=Epilithonimonas arachidiradicis TaxID=1617282 RepID=A0A420DA53_9FLAO|nr:hypothetical protein [Epilithonimonas arachidiradicis]RKE87830.1 hypothetical protein BXY58_1966 [Epilithonimonas arachidiradicis]GGG58227.1 hypothetical protein GCM10007332_19960 [Epilithonimonas arachidiradicis]